MKLHVVGLPHTETTPEFFTCAYTQKLVKFGKMMTALDYEVILYSGEVNTTVCTEHVPIVTREEQHAWFGRQTQDMLPTIQWDPHLPYWRTMNKRAVDEIGKRLDIHNDLILLIGGTAQKPIAMSMSSATNCEFGIGYSGIFSDHKVFESYAWMHHIYGRQFKDVGNFYDAVIPNYFDREDFLEPAKKSGDYLLFLGRMIQNKGPHVAAEIAERTGMPLVMAGNGCLSQENGEIKSAEVTVKVGDVPITHVGPADFKRRAELMQGAAAVVMPTLYLEPFGGVAVEAMMSGTPVIAPDFGAFTETIRDGETGFRFHTLAEAADAVQQAKNLNKTRIRQYALDHYSLEAVGPLYDRYFKQLQGLWGKGWYE